MNLMEGMIAEVNRVKDEVMPIYRDIGASGAIALAVMKQQVATAEKAMCEGDTMAMLAIYSELKDIHV